MNKISYSKEDAVKELETINFWINNSDTKASITLGLIGVVFTIIFSDNSFINLTIQLLQKVIVELDFSDILFLLFLSLSFYFIIYGIYKICKVLIPKLKINGLISKSLTYYGYISTLTKDDYKNMIKNANNEDIFDDLLNQIYINSNICNKKFNNYKDGLLIFIIGLLLNILICFSGIIVYL